jgi:serine/threonine-protein kinase
MPHAPPFVRRLHDLGLLKPAQLAELRRALGDDFHDVRALGRELLRRDWLTAYQVNQLHRDGPLVLGPYLLLGRLGAGGMGEVYRARHRHMGRAVALKLIRKDRLGGNGPARFLREVETAARLNHPHIVHAYDADVAGGRPFLAMEYVEGPSLRQLVEGGGPLPVPLACAYVRQAALGLEHAHERGVVHRDVKPSNLLLQEAAARVKVADFGLARRWDGPAEAALTRAGMVVGTVDYMAPERAESGVADVRGDLYSLGCTWYFLLSGRVPFPAASPEATLLRHLRDEPEPLRGVPPAVTAVLGRLMAKRPEARYRAAAELAGVLEGLPPSLASVPEGRTRPGLPAAACH